jgi:two-component system NtrC family sensor kinase
MMQNPYTRLRRQMLTVLLLFGLAPLVAMGVAGFLANREEAEARARAVVEAAVQGRKAALELFLDARLDALAAVASQPLSALATTGGLERAHRLLPHGAGGFIDLALLDAKGRCLAYTGPYGPPPPEASAPWLEEAAVLGRYQSDVVLAAGRFRHVLLAVARREGGELHVLRATLDAAALGAILGEGGFETTTDLLLVNRAGAVQAALDETIHRPLSPAGVAMPPFHSGVRIVEGELDARRAILASAWLRDRWALVARQRLPGLPGDLLAHPIVLAVFVLGALLVPPLSLLVARHRLQQIQALEAERATLLESVAQSQKMATIGRLAATVAHEINNPLAVIGAQVGVMSDCLEGAKDGALARELSERVQKVEAQVERARAVTHRLLGFSRRVGSDLEPVDLRAALEEAVGFVEKASEASGTRFVRNYQLDVPTVRTSLAQAQQVFLNLVNNAVDALGGEGEVLLSIRGGDEGVVVTIADDGPGIPESTLRHLFEPFHSTKKGDHAGLGLAICREIMQTLGGAISVESREGQGTAFTLRFPPAAPEGDAARQEGQA